MFLMMRALIHSIVGIECCVDGVAPATVKFASGYFPPILTRCAILLPGPGDWYS